LNVLAYADDFVLIGNRNKTTFVETENIAKTLELNINESTTKYMKTEKISKHNKIRQLTIKNYTFAISDNFKYLGVIFKEDKNH
jgi:hypothetical protein